MLFENVNSVYCICDCFICRLANNDIAVIMARYVNKWISKMVFVVA